MNTEPWLPCSIFRECPTRRSVKSCVSRKEQYVRGSSMRIGSCKITWTNFETIPCLNQHPETAHVVLQSQPTTSMPASAEREWNIASPVATRILRTQPVRTFHESAPTHRAATPSYVLDSVPVSYEPTFRF